jgi:SAM-dependent methyltransferase
VIGELARRFHAADVRWCERYILPTPLHPGFWVRRRLRAAVAEARARAHGVLFDVGCGQKPYAPMLSDRISRYIGMEYAPGSGYRGNAADVCGDAAAIPLVSSSVDTVLCTEVLEHVPDPYAVVREIARVLKPGGTLICTAPFCYPKHDEYDFFRYSPGAVATLMRRAGLEIISERPLAGTGVTLAVLFNLYWFEAGFLWTRWLYPIGVVLRPILWLLAAAVNIAGWAFEHIIPSTLLSFNHLTIGARPAVAEAQPGGLVRAVQHVA